MALPARWMNIWIRYNYDTSHYAANSLWYTVTGTQAVPFSNFVLATNWNTFFFTRLSNATAASVVIDSVQFFYEDGTILRQHYFPLNTFGGAATTHWQSTLCPLIQTSTGHAGRSAQGRIWLPPVAKGFMTGEHYSAPGRNTLNFLKARFNTQWTSQGVTFHPALRSIVEDTLVPITSMTLFKYPRTYYRRRSGRRPGQGPPVFPEVP